MSVHHWAAAILHEMTGPDRRHWVDTLTLHKLTYLCQGWHLALIGEPAYQEPITAGANGPHIPALAATGPDAAVYTWPAGNKDQLTPKQRHVVRAVVASYGAKSGPALAKLTQEHEAWLDAREGSSAAAGTIEQIDVDAIREEFTQMAEESRRRQERRDRLARLKATDSGERAR